MYKRLIAPVILLALMLSLSSTAAASVDAAASVFINEIHYDNSGADTGERVEVAGPAGTDLAGWSLVLYNGNGGSGYNTISLSGLIPDQQNGFGTLSVDTPGLQNGSPDGLALIDSSSTVVQFLSYEGSFTAADGPAAGMTSVDIGVSEPGDTPIDHSLQLTGSGTVYGDFTWSSPQPNTFGAVNAGQSFAGGGGGQPAAPILNEFVFNHTGSDTGAFIEVYGDANTNYGAYTVLELEGDSGIGTIDAVLPVGTTNGAGFWTSNEDVENGTVTLLLVEGFSGSAGDDLDTNDDGTLDSTPWTAVVDDVAVSDGDAGDQTYAAAVLTPGYDGISFSVGGASRIPNATDTDAAADWVRNDFDGLGLAGYLGSIDAGEAVNTPSAPNAQLADNLAPIQDIQTTGGNDSPFVGQTVTTAGVVTAVFVDGSEVNVFIQDGAGPWSGIFLFNPTPTPNVGDLVQVTDEVEEFHDLTELAFSSIDVLASNVTVPTPDVLATGDVSQEQWESVLVRVENATVTNEDLGFGEWSVSDSSGDVRVDDLGTYSYSPNNGDLLDFVQGPLYFSFGNFKIEPRDDGDIGVAPPPAEACGDPFTPVYDIQGSGLTSPLDGSVVSTEGVVVGDFQDGDGDVFDTDLGGVYIQDSAGDGDPTTSDGVFVFAPDAMDLQTGDRIRVAGEVDEFFDLTQLTNVSTVLLCSSGNTVASTSVTLPVTSRDDLEPYEGMLVTFPQELYISEYFNFDRFGEIVLTTERQFQPTAVYEPGSPEAAQLAQENALGRITLDDGRSVQNPDPARHPNGNVFDLDNRFRGGDTVKNLSGILSYSFGLYRIQPTAGADYTSENPRPEMPADVGGNLTVAAFNVLNYFLTIDNAGSICGPNQDQDCRGADTQAEFERQRAKIISALADIEADVYGLIEMENTTGVKPLQDIVAGLNAELGAGTYDFIDTGTIGPDAIKVGIIYKPATVSPVGDYAVLDSDAFLDPNNLGEAKNRPALAQSFIDDTTGGIFTVVVNHLKSKGSSCGPGDDDPQQGNCNLTRTLAAQELVDWLATDPTGSGDADALIIGDLNAYDKEDPIDAIREGPDDTLGTGDDYSDLLFQYLEEFAYSYVFDGQLGYLDYGMANQDLASEVTGITVWHINTDEPDILDYDTTFKQDAQDALYEPNAYRSSDHDPVIVGLNVCDEIAPTVDVSVTPDTLWPPNHMYVTVEASITASDNFDPNPAVTLVSVTSNEPDNGEDDGNTVNDIVVVDDDTFQLRAERSGVGNGRVYTITYEVTDACGNSTVASAEVVVPIDR